MYLKPSTTALRAPCFPRKKVTGVEDVEVTGVDEVEGSIIENDNLVQCSLLYIQMLHVTSLGRSEPMIACYVKDRITILKSDEVMWLR